MPYKKGYGMEKAKDFGIKKTKAWGEKLKGGHPVPKLKKGVK